MEARDIKVDFSSLLPIAYGDIRTEEAGKEYRVKNNKEIPQVQYSLDKWPWFERYTE